MKKTWMSGFLLLGVSALLMTAGCKGDGGSTPFIPPKKPPTSAVVKLYIDGTTTGNEIGGAEVTLHLSPGVSVKTDQNPPQTDPGVVTASGLADLDISTYSSVDHTVTVKVVKASGFDVGEIAVVNCDILSGYKPAASEFSVSDLKVWDLVLGSDITEATGVQPNLTVSFK